MHKNRGKLVLAHLRNENFFGRVILGAFKRGADTQYFYLMRKAWILQPHKAYRKKKEKGVVRSRLIRSKDVGHILSSLENVISGAKLSG